MNLIKKFYYYFWHDLMKRNEPYTATLRRWVRAHPKLTRLIVGGSIAGFVSWLAFVLHIFELW